MCLLPKKKIFYAIRDIYENTEDTILSFDWRKSILSSFSPFYFFIVFFLHLWVYLNHLRLSVNYLLKRRRSQQTSTSHISHLAYTHTTISHMTFKTIEATTELKNIHWIFIFHTRIELNDFNTLIRPTTFFLIHIRGYFYSHTARSLTMKQRSELTPVAIRTFTV